MNSFVLPFYGNGKFKDAKMQALDQLCFTNNADDELDGTEVFRSCVRTQTANSPTCEFTRKSTAEVFVGVCFLICFNFVVIVIVVVVVIIVRVEANEGHCARDVESSRSNSRKQSHC